MKKPWYIFGFCAIMLGVLLGTSVNKWLGYGLIALGVVWALVCVLHRPVK